VELEGDLSVCLVGALEERFDDVNCALKERERERERDRKGIEDITTYLAHSGESRLQLLQVIFHQIVIFILLVVSRHRAPGSPKTPDFILPPSRNQLSLFGGQVFEVLCELLCDHTHVIVSVRGKER